MVPGCQDIRLTKKVGFRRFAPEIRPTTLHAYGAKGAESIPPEYFWLHKPIFLAMNQIAVFAHESHFVAGERPLTNSSKVFAKMLFV